LLGAMLRCPDGLLQEWIKLTVDADKFLRALVSGSAATNEELIAEIRKRRAAARPGICRCSLERAKVLIPIEQHGKPENGIVVFRARQKFESQIRVCDVAFHGA